MPDREERQGEMQETPETGYKKESGGRDSPSGGEMKSKQKNMASFAEKMGATQPVDVQKKWFPSITVNAEDVSIGDAKVGSMATLHAHAKVKRIEDTEEGKKITLEIQKGDAKPGIRPSAKFEKKSPGKTPGSIANRIRAGK
jgi:hypothetical protein